MHYNYWQIQIQIWQIQIQVLTNTHTDTWIMGSNLAMLSTKIFLILTGTTWDWWCCIRKVLTKEIKTICQTYELFHCHVYLLGQLSIWLKTWFHFLALTTQFNNFATNATFKLKRLQTSSQRYDKAFSFVNLWGPTKSH